MLVLFREVGQLIHIGNDIVIKVLGTERGYRVQVGIEAPRSVKVDRGEKREAERRERDGWRKNYLERIGKRSNRI